MSHHKGGQKKIYHYGTSMKSRHRRLLFPQENVASFVNMRKNADTLIAKDILGHFSVLYLICFECHPLVLPHVFIAVTPKLLTSLCHSRGLRNVNQCDKWLSL